MADRASALVSAHLWLPPVRCRVLGLRRAHAAWDDCVQEGAIAMWSAAQRFDADRGVRFEHYARSWVDSAIKTHLCTLGPVREPTRRVRDRAARGERAHPTTIPDVGDIAADGEGEDTLLDAIDRARRIAEVRRAVRETVSERERDALLGTIGREESIRAYADRALRARESTRLDVHAGLSKLRERLEDGLS